MIYLSLAKAEYENPAQNCFEVLKEVFCQVRFHGFKKKKFLLLSNLQNVPFHFFTIDYLIV